jgi:mannose-1-phosphate guanylyltransferase
MKYAVIMAGGTGKRLWPLSRRKRPKQVLKLFDGQTLLRRCFDRLAPIFDAGRIIVLTNAAYVDVVRENLRELPTENVIAEPAVRDTASAIGLVSAVLSKQDPDATMAVVTADQIIEPVELLQQAIEDAMEFVDTARQALVTFGVKPTFPNTMLGYIKCVNPANVPGCRNEVYKVERFAEKPDESTAAEYVDSGQYFWNSGMFVWKAETMLANLERFLPDVSEPLTRIRDAWGTQAQKRALEEWFVKLPKISIDYAVMERSQEVHAIKLDCRWLDLGAFRALGDIVGPDGDNNVVVAGATELLDCANSMFVTEDKGHLIAAIGIEGLVVAHSPDATLICPVEKTDRLKELIDLIEKHGKEGFL